MIFKSNKEYERLSRKAVLWDSLPFEHINFTGRVVDKYGRNYFNERYAYITGDFYKDIKRTNLDTVDKIIGLSMANNAQQEHTIDNEFIKVMNVPEEYKEIWKNTIPLRYYEDYKERKVLLDSYLKTLPPEKQAFAIKTMCLNNESKNYLAFLDLQENEMTIEQKHLFDEIVHFFEANSYDENLKKQELAQKAMKSKKYSTMNDKVTEEVNDFLLNNDIKNDDVSYINMIQDNNRDLEFFKTNNQYDDNYRFTISAPNLDNTNLRDKFQNIQYKNNDQNNQELTNPFDTRINNQQPIYANSYTQGFVDNKTTRDEFKPQNKTINQFDKLFNNANNNSIFNNVQKNDMNNSLNVASITNKQKQLFNKQNVNSNIEYKQYIKSPSVYNIVDLINNRDIESTNNRDVVDQIVKSTIQVNNQYTKQGAKYNSPIVDGKFSNNMNNNYQKVNSQLTNNDQSSRGLGVVSLSEIKNNAVNNAGKSPLGTMVANTSDSNDYIPKNNGMFDFQKPERTSELINLKTIKPRLIQNKKQIDTNNKSTSNIGISKPETKSTINLAPNTLNIPNYVNKFSEIVNGNQEQSSIADESLNNSIDNQTNNSYEFIKPFRPKISLNLDNDNFNFEPSFETKNEIKKSAKENSKSRAKTATSNNIPVIKRKVSSTSKSKTVMSTMRK